MVERIFSHLFGRIRPNKKAIYWFVAAERDLQSDEVEMGENKQFTVEPNSQ
jgi:hypothetical protein